MLHGENEIVRGVVTSDVDIVVDRRVYQVLRTARHELRVNGLHYIIVYPYDPGGSAAVFICDETASRGVHLDLYFDPRGVGRFGIRTSRLFDDTSQGERWPIVSGQHQAAYLLRKRHWKGDLLDLERQRSILQESGFDPNGGLFVPRVARSVERVIESGIPGRFVVPAPHNILNLVRWIRRLMRPIGFWMHVTGSSSGELARHLAERFGRFVITTRAENAPTRPMAKIRWFVQSVLPVTLRAGVFVSWSKQPPKYGPDLVVDSAGDLSDLSRVAVATMEQRCDP